jgi:hypothetical protein
MSVLDAVHTVLSEAGQPLHYRDITERMVAGGMWQPGGKTPHATVNARLAADIKRHGPGSRFRRVGAGVFALNEPVVSAGDAGDGPSQTDSGEQGRHMATREVADAFDLLLEELGNYVDELRESAVQATRKGNTKTARGLLDRQDDLAGFVQSVRSMAKQWHEAWVSRGQEKRHARVGSEGPAKKVSKRFPRLRTGMVTKQREYRLPILHALERLGGEAPLATVLGSVYTEMESRLLPADKDPLPASHGRFRWRNAAMFERYQMVTEGLLRGDSPRGVWAITDRGRALAAEHQAMSTDDGPPQAPFRAADGAPPPPARTPNGAPRHMVGAPADEDAEEDPAAAMNRFLRSES